MSLGVHSFVESSNRPHLTKSCAVWHRTLTLAVRNVPLLGGNVYAEDEIHGAEHQLIMKNSSFVPSLV